VKRNIVFGAGLLALGFVVGLLLVDQIDQRNAPAIVIDDPRVDAKIVVSVEGAVVAPGTYSLSGDARVQNALDAAGGPTDDADLSGLNLAARLSDEERLIVPMLGEEGVRSPQSGTPGAGGQTPVPTASNLININTADAATLETLPRIGPALAAAIIEYRGKNGPFRSVDELAQVSGVSLAMVDELRALITV
jgi:competence protein ComEA